MRILNCGHTKAFQCFIAFNLIKNAFSPPKNPIHLHCICHLYMPSFACHLIALSARNSLTSPCSTQAHLQMKMFNSNWLPFILSFLHMTDILILLTFRRFYNICFFFFLLCSIGLCLPLHVPTFCLHLIVPFQNSFRHSFAHFNLVIVREPANASTYKSYKMKFQTEIKR